MLIEQQLKIVVAVKRVQIAKQRVSRTLRIVLSRSSSCNTFLQAWAPTARKSCARIFASKYENENVQYVENTKLHLCGVTLSVWQRTNRTTLAPVPVRAAS